jgi:hypothetical protein
MSTLLVTTAIGKKYFCIYNNLFRKSQENYARRHGYDFKIVTDLLDVTYKTHLISFYFQHILLCSQPWNIKYDFIVFIDSDILIHPEAPSITAAIDFKSQIGMVDEYSQPNKVRRLELQKEMGWEASATDYYSLCGFNLNTEVVLNGGLMVMQPRYHNELLGQVYKEYLPKALNHPRGPHYQQASIGYALQSQGNHLILPNKWNAIWSIHKLCNPDYLLSDFYQENYFTHFAGQADLNLVPMLLPND